MSFLRHDLFPLTVALVAALAVLFVSTISMACEAPVDQGVMSMSMSDDSGPCDRKTEKAPCQKACLASCQGLFPQADGPAAVRIYSSVRYPSLEVRRADVTLEADDPPPRA